MFLYEFVISYLLLWNNIYLPVWSVTMLSLCIIVTVYVKNMVVFMREKKHLRLIFLSILMFVLCTALLIMCCNYYD